MQWFVLCGIPYRGTGDAVTAISTDPTNRLPFSHPGRPLKATRKRPLLNLQLFKISTSCSCLQLVPGSCRSTQLRLAENSSALVPPQPGRAVESAGNCGKTRACTDFATTRAAGQGWGSVSCSKSPAQKVSSLIRAGTRYWLFAMTPRSVRPFTKNCMASATSSRPMMRTRMRIPVSPRTARTRSAPASTQ